MRLNERIEKNIKRVLNERLTDKVYHFLKIDNLLQICKDDTFYLTASLASSADIGFNRGKMFYGSFSRTKSNKTGYGKKLNCRIELDGDALNSVYKSTPINYYVIKKANDDGTYSYHAHKGSIDYYGKYDGDTYFEYEDRIISDKGLIPNFHKYVTRIDIWCEPYEINEISAYLAELNKTIYRDCIHIYDNKKSFVRQSNDEAYQVSAFEGDTSTLRDKYHGFYDRQDDNGYVIRYIANFWKVYYVCLSFMKKDYQGVYEEKYQPYWDEMMSKLQKYNLEPIGEQVLEKIKSRDYKDVTSIINDDLVGDYTFENLKKRPSQIINNALQMISDQLRSIRCRNMKDLAQLYKSLLEKFNAKRFGLNIRPDDNEVVEYVVKDYGDGSPITYNGWEPYNNVVDRKELYHFLTNYVTYFGVKGSSKNAASLLFYLDRYLSNDAVTIADLMKTLAKLGIAKTYENLIMLNSDNISPDFFETFSNDIFLDGVSYTLRKQRYGAISFQYRHHLRRNPDEE